MKAKLCILTILSLLACSLAGMAQNNSTPAAETPTAATAAADTTQAAPAAAVAAADTAPAVQATDSPAAQPAAPAAPAPDATNAPAAATNAPAAEAPATNAPAADAPSSAAPTLVDNKPAGTNAAPVGPPIIPLIVMDDVPLTDAIKNLARQASLNYMLDPRVAFGQIGPDGKAVPQPSVSIRWENVSAEQALTALLNNYGLQMSEDTRSHIARISVKDPSAPDPLVTKIFQLKFASPSNILASVQATLTDKRSKVVADVRTSQVVVLATERELAAVEGLVDRLDTQTKQVLIEARLIETSMNPSTIKGINWAGTLQGQHVSFGNNLQQKPVDTGDSVNRPLSTLWPKLMMDTAKGFNPATAFLDADGVSAVLSFLNLNSEAKVLSTPRTVTLDNEPAVLSVTRASPIINITAGTANTTGGSQITYTNLGVILHVLPRISANNFVNLRVTPEVSRIFDTVSKNAGVNGTFEADEYDIRRIDTHVMIPSGNTLVLGGLVQDDVRQSNTKVPVLGDIPVLGYAFRSDSKSRQKNNLVIFITPTIVQDSDYQPTKSDFLKSPVPLRDSVESDWSSWDSGKPKDWSKADTSKSDMQ